VLHTPPSPPTEGFLFCVWVCNALCMRVCGCREFETQRSYRLSCRCRPCRTTRFWCRPCGTTRFRNTISVAIHRQGWKVEQISFVTVSRSMNKQDLKKNLKFFKVPEANMQSTYSKLVMRVFDVYIFSNACAVLVLTGAQRGRRLPQKPNRYPLLSTSYVNGDSMESLCRFIKGTKPCRNLELSPLSVCICMCVFR
jgi:hypothetical protein